MKWIKRFFSFILLAIALYAIINYRLVAYGIQQLKGQLHIIYTAKPVEYFLNDKEFPEAYKKKLLLIEAVRKYAIDSLGLKNSKNYTTLYDQKDKPALWVLTASEPFKMQSYEWNFPFLGAVTYKGFFDETIGIKEELQLKERFLDTDLSPAGGWSTLGFFRDPILSGMLKRSDGRLAELIIHELTHATLYIPGSVEFNENFATFIGEEGAERFLSFYFGSNSGELAEYIYLKRDSEVFGNYMLHACSRLDSLYTSFTDENFRLKLEKKYALIIDIVSRINHLPLHNKERYRFSFPGDELPNNTDFLSYKTYRGSQKQMSGELKQLNNDLRQYILSMKGKSK